MDLMTAIAERRAIRAYTDEGIGRETVARLIDAGVQAPSAMDLEPWAFLVFEGKSRLREFSQRAKDELGRAGTDLSPEARRLLSDPSFDIFYGAPLLIVICATSAQSQAAEDCCLAAQNLMLAAHAEGLATCPIGFARPWFNRPGTKKELGIPPEYVPVFPPDPRARERTSRPTGATPADHPLALRGSARPAAGFQTRCRALIASGRERRARGAGRERPRGLSRLAFRSLSA